MAPISFFEIFCLTYYCVGVVSQMLPSTFDFVGSRRPGTTCTFNPCTVPNFCGSGRTCKIDKHCVSRCECLEESSHPDCVKSTVDKLKHAVDIFGGHNADKLGNTVDKEAQSIDTQLNEIKREPADIKQSIDDTKLSIVNTKQSVEPVISTTETRTTTTDSPDCLFDPCTTMGWICDEGRQCINRGCLVHCECTPDSTHSSCIVDQQTPPAANETEDCGGFTGMKCQHGTCVQIGDALSCECDADWKGALCDQHVSTGCTRQCDYGYECMWYTDTMQICTPIQTTPKQDGFYHDNITSETVISNVCTGEYTPHDVSQRNCSAGVQCQYGVCQNAHVDGAVCRCDPGAFGVTCNETCCRDCGDGGECYVDDSHGNELCRCLHNYTGINCTEMKSRETDSHWYVWVVGTCSGVLLVLIVLVVVIPYVMWKHRVILVMKVVHYFQGYEDDDEREWDAFISYKSTPTDEAFVTRVLFRKLEEEFGFKLNVHFRDFIPGDTIANNIIRAIRGSRRTILIITPQYIKGEYTKLEYQVAQQQMLKHKHRIIPILLEDISDCEQYMDPNLKFILRSVTYLEWPRNDSAKQLSKFWKRLQLSMPKKRNQNQQNNILEPPNALEINHPKRVPIKPPGKIEQNGQNGVAVTQIQIENEADHYCTIQDVVRL